MIEDARLRRKKRRDMDDLIGDIAEDDGYIESPQDKLSFSSKDLHRISGGVSIQWLAKAFRMTRHNVQKSLGDIRPVGVGDYGQPLYDLPEAAQLLVAPIVDIKKYLKTAKTSELPENLREAVWNSKLKAQRWEEKAGHLWRTENVMSFFGDILADIRDRLQLIPDKVERMHGLTIENYRLIRHAVDEVQEEIHDRIVAMAKTTTIKSQLHDEKIDRDEDDLI
jgi:hypothetical protein